MPWLLEFLSIMSYSSHRAARHTATEVGMQLLVTLTELQVEVAAQLEATRRLQVLHPTTQHSLLTPHPSPLTPHSSLLTPHSSLLTPHPSLLTPHSSLLTPHSSFLTTTDYLPRCRRARRRKTRCTR